MRVPYHSPSRAPAAVRAASGQEVLPGGGHNGSRSLGNTHNQDDQGDREAEGHKHQCTAGAKRGCGGERDDDNTDLHERRACSASAISLRHERRLPRVDYRPELVRRREDHRQVDDDEQPHKGKHRE